MHELGFNGRAGLRCTWSHKRFVGKKLLHKASRHLLAVSINHLLERDHRQLCEQNDGISRSMDEVVDHLDALEEKLTALNEANLFLHTPPSVYLEQRLARLRRLARQRLAAFERDVREEIEHWQYLQAVLHQPLLETGLLRSYYGGLPQIIQQSPSSELHSIEEQQENTPSSVRTPSRSLAPINTFSILSNTISDDCPSVNRLNRTFIKRRLPASDVSMNDENVTARQPLKTMLSRKKTLAAADDSVIFID